jgi:CBS domain-containing protein
MNARKIAEILKDWIEKGQFFLSSPVQRLPQDSKYKPMRQTREMKFVRELLHPAITCREEESVQAVAERIIDESVNHIVVVNPEGYLRGIVTSWDITNAVARGKNELKEIIVRDVVCASPDDPTELASRKMAQHSISALPVVDSQNLVLGIVTAEDLSRLLRR